MFVLQNTILCLLLFFCLCLFLQSLTIPLFNCNYMILLNHRGLPLPQPLAVFKSRNRPTCSPKIRFQQKLALADVLKLNPLKQRPAVAEYSTYASCSKVNLLTLCLFCFIKIQEGPSVKKDL